MSLTAIARALAPTALALVAALPAAAQEVGRFALVQNEVLSLKPGTTEPVAASAGASVLLLERETTGANSAAKLTFGEGAVVSLGQHTTFSVTQQAVDEATGASTSTIDLAAGKLRLFVSRFWSGRPEVRVNTPSVVVGVKGSEVVVEVLRDGRTTVTVLSGSATLTPRGSPRASITLGAAQQVRLWPDGSPTQDPGPVSQEALDELWARTEPDPAAPRPLPTALPTLALPAAAAWQDMNATVARARQRYPTSSGAPAVQSGAISDPAATVIPFFPPTDQRGGTVRPPDTGQSPNGTLPATGGP